MSRARRRAADMPVVISFTVETDGKLPTGQTLKDAIVETDLKTDNTPAYYMLNCAHPTHFAGVLNNEPWVRRLRGLRANASTRSHAELDAAPDLDAGDPVALGRQYRELRQRLPRLTILGGCCGTDHRHVEQICFACTRGGIAQSRLTASLCPLPLWERATLVLQQSRRGEGLGPQPLTLHLR